MLDAVYQRWIDRTSTGRPDTADSGAGAGAVFCTEPSYFYPTYDPMQREAFRGMCDRDGLEHAEEQFVDTYPELVAAHLCVCAELQGRDYNNSVPRGGIRGAYAVHHWAHTWIYGSEKVDLTDTVAIDAARSY